MPFIAEELPELPAANLIGEPDGRDTAAAVALSAAIIQERDKDAVIGVFTADHIITPMDRFARIVEQAYGIAKEEPDALITMGVRPSRPDTNYGYIKRGERVGDGVYRALHFTEKPNVPKAMTYLEAGEYFWNSGMFVWRADTILGELEKHLPPTYEAVKEIAAQWSGDARQATLESLYPKLMKISIDFAVMEHAEKVLVLEMDCHWVDVGSWTAIESVLPNDADGNVSACPQAIHLGSRGTIVVSEEKHLIATIGLDDIVVVHSPDATLICRKRDAHGIKELVNNITQEFGEEYL